MNDVSKIFGYFFLELIPVGHVYMLFPEMCLNFWGSSWLHACSTLKDAGPIRSKSDSKTASTSPLRHCAHTKLLKPTVGLELGILFEPVILSKGTLYVPLSAIVSCG